jgi:hypothetical protein
LAVFERIRYRRADESVFSYAFDLLELDGQDLRREPIETRKGRWRACCAAVGSRCGTRLDISAPSILMHRGVASHSPGEGWRKARPRQAVKREATRIGADGSDLAELRPARFYPA